MEIIKQYVVVWYLNSEVSFENVYLDKNGRYYLSSNTDKNPMIIIDQEAFEFLIKQTNEYFENHKI